MSLTQLMKINQRLQALSVMVRSPLGLKTRGLLLGLVLWVFCVPIDAAMAPWDAMQIYPVGAKVAVRVKRNLVCQYTATRAPIDLGLTNQNLSPVYFSGTHSEWDFWSSTNDRCNLTHPVNQRIVVPAASGPWLAEDNPTMAYQKPNESPAFPVLIPVNTDWQGQTLGIICLGGTVNSGGLPDNDCEGLSHFEASDHRYQSACGSYYPSHYLADNEYPVYIMQLIGSFADANGQVIGKPFLIKSTERLHAIPRDAQFIQLGINDCLFGPGNGGSANYGAFVVGYRISPTPDP